MELYSLLISKDNGWEIMDALGKISALHFLDLNQRESTGTRYYSASIRRCDEAERSLHFIEEEARRFGVGYRQPESVEQFFEAAKAAQKSVSANALVDHYEAELKERENFLKDQSKRFQDMQERKAHLKEHLHVLAKTSEIMEKGLGSQQSSAEPLLAPADMRFASLSGVVNTADAERLKRLVFRASRGILQG